MRFSIRFLDGKGDPVEEKVFRTEGQSGGWTGSLSTVPFKHRREAIQVPERASGVWVAMSSAGPPSAVGVWAVTNLTLSTVRGGASSELVRLGFNAASLPATNEPPPIQWIQDGTHASMARVMRAGAERVPALVIVDDDIEAHAEWHTIKGPEPRVSPGETLVAEWDEAYSIGNGGYSQVTYARLSAGFYRFQVNSLTVWGLPGEAETSIALEVPQPMWRTPWFWGMMAALVISGAAGSYRYLAWRQMRRDLQRIEGQQALERERLRIAQDIHDDLGARVTQISLVSAMAGSDKTLSEKTRTDFDSISRMSRELVSALYETVWAVNPENDNLDALGNYICQTVHNLCEQTQLRRRLNVAELPRECAVSSQIRHNLAMAVKEAVHNVIKHARATEVAVQVVLEADMLTVRVSDDGCGFEPARRESGNGLSNMKDRLARVGGFCAVNSQPGKGTTVEFQLKVARCK